MNCKLRYRSAVVHHLASDFPDEDWGCSERNKPGSVWALCGGSGTRKLKETNEPVTCKNCLSIAYAIKNGTHKHSR